MTAANATSGAALLPVKVGKVCAFFRYAVDVRRLVPHHAAVIALMLN
jgi:hypothetical protein